MPGSDDKTMSAIETVVRVRNKNGLHARPSSVLAETALKFTGTTIRLRRGDVEVDAKSIMELLLLEAHCDAELALTVEGDETEAAVAAIRGLFEREFDIAL